VPGRYSKHIADDAVVRDLEDRASLSLLIATIVFDVRIAGQVLNRAEMPTGDVTGSGLT
jgi:hypothetical protein